MQGVIEPVPSTLPGALSARRAYLLPKRSAGLSPSRPSEVYTPAQPSDFLLL
jgi:hypothetical protein